jgi:hypothetical protein
MIGQVTKFKFSIEDSKMLQKAYDVIQLTEPHEAGEIINDNWMILNDNVIIVDSDCEENKGKYSAGYYVKIVDLRFCDIIETDINYDNRNDLRKINTKTIFVSNEVKTVNVYAINV